MTDRIDTSVAHPARRYDYWLGGKDNFQADRDSGDQIAKLYPGIRTAAVENRRFLRRAVTYLTREAGIRQFLDIGTGIPTADNTHEVAQRIAPDARIVYVDNDPIVLAHARALLRSSKEGRTAYLDADLRDPDRILADADLRDTLDLTRPVGLMLIAVLHFVTDEEEPYAIVRRLLDALPPGSHLALSHGTLDFIPPEVKAAAAASGMRSDMYGRTRDEVARFLDGLEIVEPGIVAVPEWRGEEEPAPRPAPGEVSVYGAVARKP
ncbi:hypothetical protein Val02_13890 [Virgisporangium aliadipatigenens]|uniref:Methyltransferase n=1 Tax=Virgisporangium aliadipatigenens TaxID=741659 RepID=A0A8J4DPC8_9ACTN|nr:SAM-dependent methyltransferase [Virgisporangium aliadipatigenens]GIJ44503.1 hypothetical protein Val02_13890 [Virgisporangium aliadipatigenens]